MYLRSWRAGYAGLVDPQELDRVAAERSSVDWRAELSDREASFGLGLVDGVAAGVVKIGPDPTKDRRGSWLKLLYIVPEHWGTGLSVELVNHAVANVRSLGEPTIRLRVVDRQFRARRFYEREGWVYDPDIPTSSNSWFPLLCMRKDVARLSH